MKKFNHYFIAGTAVGVSGGSLDHIPGFSVFAEDKEEVPDVVINLGKTLFDIDIKPLYSFDFEGLTCDFSFSGEKYFYRMTHPSGKCLLTEMHLQEDTLCVETNMDEQTPQHWLRFVVWLSFGVFSVCRQTVAIHASAILYKGKSILFLGESGAGKSTHTRLWLKHIPGAELLNDDSPFVCADENNTIAFGSPWSGKTDCFRNVQVPVAGLVRLIKAPYNRIKKLSGLSAIGALLPSCPPAFAYDEFLSDKVCCILSSLLLHVPVYSLECLPDEKAVQLVLSTFINDRQL